MRRLPRKRRTNLAALAAKTIFGGSSTEHKDESYRFVQQSCAARVRRTRQTSQNFLSIFIQKPPKEATLLAPASQPHLSSIYN